MREDYDREKGVKMPAMAKAGNQAAYKQRHGRQFRGPTSNDRMLGNATKARPLTESSHRGRKGTRRTYQILH